MTGTLPRQPDAPECRAAAAFRSHLGGEPDFIVRAPGRVNLIGEHTDYNDGFVMPLAIDLRAAIALRPRADGRVRLHAAEFGEFAEFALADLGEAGRSWIDHVKGTAFALRESGLRLEGFEGVLSSDVPIGSGLSSSAAIEVASARAFCAVSGFPWDPVAAARAAQRAENAWMGVNCGIMDPLISAAGRAGHALLIDCRSLEMRPVPIPSDTVVVVLDTMTRRKLVGSEYNDRQRECASVAAECGVAMLRDVDESALGGVRASVGDVAFRRARHVITENRRTLDAADALASGDGKAVGALMNASHESLRHDFEVSTPALDAMVASAREAPGCLGARLTGAGFGGCVVALVDRDRVKAFGEVARERYAAATGLVARIYPCEPVAGAEIVSAV